MSTKKTPETGKMEKERVYPKGVLLFENTSVEGKKFNPATIVIQFADFKQWVEEDGKECVQNHEKYGKQIRFELRVNKDGKLYLCTYKPLPKSNTLL